MEASSVFSKSCERSVDPGVIAGVKSDHAPHSSATATHDAAALQSPRTHHSIYCAAPLDTSNAITRFSKAYGT